MTHGGSPGNPGPSGAPEPDRAALDRPGDALARLFGHRLGQDQLAAARGRRTHHGGGQDVPGYLIQQGRQGRISSRGSAPADTTAVTAGWPMVSVPVRAGRPQARQVAR